MIHRPYPDAMKRDVYEPNRAASDIRADHLLSDTLVIVHFLSSGVSMAAFSIAPSRAQEATERDRVDAVPS